jgi:cell division septation protein DedD
MRNLVLALILAHLAVAAWTGWVAGEPGGVPMQGAAGERTLTLVSELGDAAGESGAPASAADPGSMTSEPTSPPAAARAAAGPRCVSLGPFSEPSQAANAAANLRSAGLAPTQRVSEGDIWVGYWVYLPDFATRDAANAVLARLRSSGVSDSYVVPGGDSSHTISLGVFSEIKRAGRRREEVRKLGLDPQVKDRNRRGTVYWVDLILAPDQKLPADKLQALPGRIMRLEQRDCATPV